MHIGIMGTMAQMTLSDLRDKTKRGQLGRVRAGRIPVVSPTATRSSRPLRVPGRR
jgi:hypothetical protein